MQTTETNRVFDRWPEFAGLVYVPHSQEEYERLVTILDRLTDEVGENDSHPLATLMEVVGVLVERYEDERIPVLAEASEATPERDQS